MLKSKIQKLLQNHDWMLQTYRNGLLQSGQKYRALKDLSEEDVITRMINKIKDKKLTNYRDIRRIGKLFEESQGKYDDDLRTFFLEKAQSYKDLKKKINQKTNEVKYKTQQMNKTSSLDFYKDLIDFCDSHNAHEVRRQKEGSIVRYTLSFQE